MQKGESWMDYEAGTYEIAVIGGGHAGIEAALAAARLGAQTVLFTMSLDAIGNMPCNPSIGGTAKGHLVREIDALGGEMGRAADVTMLQSRMLNRGKGPAVHSLRAQTDRKDYHRYMKHAVENQDRLDVIQAEIVDIRASDGAVESVVTALGALYHARAVILCTGTYLRGRIFVGEYTAQSGPDGLHAADQLTAALERLGLPLRRFKTGTPARADRRSIDFQSLEVQEGDDPITPFSFETDGGMLKNRAVCHIAYTNEQTHRVILENLHRSPLYSGQIEGIGPRYCPSIEDKVVRFSDKPRHQIFIEPMGLDTNEVYLQGMSSSLPEEVQVKLYRTVKGFARAVQGKTPLVLDRASSYIGTLIDDLVVKGCNDPYRMMTSRSEYRLILRQDNADMRLTPVGYEIGLIGAERWAAFLKKRELVEGEIRRLRAVHTAPNEKLNAGMRLCELLKRPQLSYASLAPFDPERPDLPAQVCEQVEITIKYEGYIKKQLEQVEQMRRLEGKQLPGDLDYQSIGGLRLEAVEKLMRLRPLNIGQASRISGVSPADVSVLLIWLSQHHASTQKAGEETND